MVGSNLSKNWNSITSHCLKWSVTLILPFYSLAKFSFVFSFNRIDIPPYENYEKLYSKLTCAVEETCGFAVEWSGVWPWKWPPFDLECDLQFDLSWISIWCCITRCDGSDWLWQVHSFTSSVLCLYVNVVYVIFNV